MALSASWPEASVVVTSAIRFQPLAWKKRQERALLVARRDLRGELVAAVLGPHARREAVMHRPVLHERRHRVADARDGRAEHHRRMVGDDLGGELHRRLRTGLVVVKDEADRLAVKPAFAIDDFFGLLDVLLLRRAQKRAAARERHHNVERGGIVGGVGRAAGHERHGQSATSNSGDMCGHLVPPLMRRASTPHRGRAFNRRSRARREAAAHSARARCATVVRARPPRARPRAPARRAS